MSIAKVNDIKVYYEIKGRGAPIVLLHGAQGDSSSFNGLFERLAKTYMVLKFDQRGSGFSDKPDMEYTMQLLAKDTAALMEHVGLSSAHIFGVSLGGMIAQAFYTAFPEKVKTMMLGCTLPGGWRKAYKKDLPEAVAIAFSADENISEIQRAKALASVAYAPGYVDKNPETTQKLIKIRQAKPVDQIGFSRRLSMTELFEGYEDLKQIKCPCLVVTGKQDQLLDYRNSILISKNISFSTLVILGDSGHVFWDEDQAFFSSAYNAFLHKFD